MKVSNHSAVPVYTISGSSTARPLPEWLARKRKRSLKTDPEYASRIELLQDFEFEEAGQCIRVSDDGQWVMSTGMVYNTAVPGLPHAPTNEIHQEPTSPKYTPTTYPTSPFLSPVTQLPSTLPSSSCPQTIRNLFTFKPTALLNSIYLVDATTQPDYLATVEISNMTLDRPRPSYQPSVSMKTEWEKSSG